MSNGNENSATNKNESNTGKLVGIEQLKSQDATELSRLSEKIKSLKRRIGAITVSLNEKIDNLKEAERIQKLEQQRIEEEKAIQEQQKQELIRQQQIAEEKEAQLKAEQEKQNAIEEQPAQEPVEQKVPETAVEESPEQAEVTQTAPIETEVKESEQKVEEPTETEAKPVEESKPKEPEQKRDNVRHLNVEDNKRQQRQPRQDGAGGQRKVFVPDNRQTRPQGAGAPNRRASNFINRDLTAEKQSIEMTASANSNNRTKKGAKTVPDRGNSSIKEERGVKKGYKREQYRDYEDDEYTRRSHKRPKEAKPIQTVVITNAVITIDPIPIKVLAEKIGRPSSDIVKRLFVLDIVVNVNASIPFETAELISLDFGVTLEFKPVQTQEEILEGIIEEEDNPDDLTVRPPVVTIMGHVDHGKTSLLDYIRKEHVVATEAGGITQHIGAYTISYEKQSITFIDTPGHEAFTTMRLRGAMVTDIAVIVIAADDSVKEQTVEAINHAKVAKVPIVIAVNKIDKPGINESNIERIKADLAKHDVMVDTWGGDTILVPVSAMTGKGVDDLLQTILLLAESLNLTANKKKSARGYIIEAKLDKNVGPLATILIKDGTLKVQDYIVAGTVMGKIKAMTDDKGKPIKVAIPSMPVSVLGFESVPNAGDDIVAVSEKLAKKVQEERKIIERSKLDKKESFRLEDLQSKLREGDIKELNLIVKGDVQGSVEAIVQQLNKLSNEEVKVNVIHSAVGGVNESDVSLAANTGAFIICFNVRPDQKAKMASARLKVDIRTYKVIYDVIDEISAALKGMLAPTFVETVLGRAEVRELFKISGVGTIAGCYVIDGKVTKDSMVRLLRNNIIIKECEIASLKRMKNDAKEVLKGFECGIALLGFNDLKVEDVIECYIIEEKEK